MTKKTQTLTRIAAAAAVLLTLCLVFTMPVGAAGNEAVIVKTGQEYATLQLALNGATGGTDADPVVIKLLKDVEVEEAVVIDKSVTLDLNGYTLSAASGYADDSIITVARGGDLTITDSAGNGKIDGTNTVSPGEGYANTIIRLIETVDLDDEEPAKLTVNGGTITGAYYAIAGNGARDNTEITINGGTLESTGKYVLYHPQQGKLTITGGTLGAGATPLTTEDKGTLAVRSGEIYISGGTFEGRVGFYNADVSAGYQTITVIEITGGNFKGVIESRNLTGTESPAAGTQPIIGFITGGSFIHEVLEDYIAEGYASEKSGDWYVVKKYVPSIPATPETPASPAPILAVFAALGAAAVLRRK